MILLEVDEGIKLIIILNHMNVNPWLGGVLSPLKIKIEQRVTTFD